MPARLVQFSDFHLHNPHEAPWRQQYVQLSPGVMHSRLSAWVGPGVQVFHKWMSERVVQQGSLPGDSLCFSLLADPSTGHSRMQGQELESHSLFLLRGEEEFEIQRPQGMALLSLSLPREAFAAALDALPRQSPARRAAVQTALRLPPAALRRLRTLLQGLLATQNQPQPADAAAVTQRLVAEMLAALTQAQTAPMRASSQRASTLVRACQQLAAAGDGLPPPTVEELTQRLGTSRRTLQNSFQQTAGISPVQYLRGVRLNRVRSRLLATPAPVLSVSQAATDQGFDHLSHFAQAYKDLFGELPSRTVRSSSVPAAEPPMSAGAATGGAQSPALASARTA